MKDKTILLRVTEAQKATLQANAAKGGMSLTAYILERCAGENVYTNKVVKPETYIQTTKKEVKAHEAVYTKPERKPLSATGWWNGNRWVEPK